MQFVVTANFCAKGALDQSANLGIMLYDTNIMAKILAHHENNGLLSYNSFMEMQHSFIQSSCIKQAPMRCGL